MPITSNIDKVKELTIFKVIDALCFDEVITAVKTFYIEKPTQNVLWDLIDTTEIELTSEEVEKVASFRPRKEGKRALGKTAFVAQQTVFYGLSRMFEIQSEIHRVPHKIKVFRSMDEALQWIDKS